jgi:hypothetical protein
VKKQKIRIYIAWMIIFGLSLPLIKINPSILLGYLPTLIGSGFIIVYALRKEKEVGAKMKISPEQ